MAAEEAKSKGNAAFSKGQYEEAIKWFTEGIKLDAKNHVLYSNRSASYASLKKYEEALKDAEKTIDINPEWPKGYSRKATALHYLGKLDEAEDTYKQGLLLEPGNAQMKQGLEDVQKAKSYQEARDDQAVNMFASAFQGDIFSKLKANPETARFLSQPDFLKKITEIQQNPNTAAQHLGDQRILGALGVLMGIPIKTGVNPNDFQQFDPMQTDSPKETKEKKEEPKKAEPKKEEPKKAEPKKEDQPMSDLPEGIRNAEAEKNLGNEAYKKKDFETAIKHYNKALDFDAGNIVYINNIAAALFEKGDFNGCIKECERAIEEGRKLRADYKHIAKALARMGNAYMKLDKIDEAVNAYSKSLTEDRTAQTLTLLQKAEKLKVERDKQAYFDPQKSLEAKERGNKFFQDNQYPDAIKEYGEAIKRNPTDHVPYSNRSASYLKLGEYRLALKDAEECVKIKPDFAKGWVRKGHAHFFLKEYEQALQAYDKGLALDPNNQELNDSVQRTLAAMNQHVDDKDRLERASQDPEVQQIMSDPVMRKILEDMQSDPKAASEHLKNPVVAAKIQKLINAGILRVA